LNKSGRITQRMSTTASVAAKSFVLSVNCFLHPLPG
jgi:hypothetical protein